MLDMILLQNFVAIVGECHFGKAAQRLGVAQSVVSSRLRRLEDVVGGRLLDRGRRSSLSLTPLGGVVLDQAHRALAAMNHAERIARLANIGAAGPVRIGYVFSAALNGTLPRTLATLAKRLPFLDCSIAALETPAQLFELGRARIDAGLLRPQSRYPEGISAQVVHREALVIGLPKTHRLAGRAALSPADLCGEDFVVPHAGRGMALGVLVDGLAAVGGFPPPPCREAPDFVSAACLVAAGQGILLGPRSLRRLAIDDIVYRDLLGFDKTLELALAWRDPPSQLVTCLLHDTNHL